MKGFNNPRAVVLLVLAATSFIILTDLAIWHFKRSPATPSVVHKAEISPGVYGPYFGPEYPEASEVKDFASAQSVIDKMKPAESFKDKSLHKAPDKAPEHLGPPKPQKKQAKISPKQYWKEHAVAAAPSAGKARIVIIIDDMGMSRKNSYDMINLEWPLTLAFLPYAPHLPEMTAEAKAKGHELLIHAPMEPMDKLNPGPLALLSGMSDAQMQEALGKMFDSFSGYVGINNHMGSKLTQDQHAMDLVMDALARRGLIFVDSKTIQTSVAAKSAAEHGLDFAERDVFLDHREDIDFVRHSLLQLEGIARKRGYAIAIGHPKPATLQGLKEWLPLAEQRGFTIVPVSSVVRKAQPQAVALNVAPAVKAKAAEMKINPNPLKKPGLVLTYGPVQQPFQRPLSQP